MIQARPIANIANNISIEQFSDIIVGVFCVTAGRGLSTTAAGALGVTAVRGPGSIAWACLGSCAVLAPLAVSPFYTGISGSKQ